MRAYAAAIQPPAGPVFLSLPLDDWDAPADGPAVVRSASIRTGPDPARLRRLADAIAGAERPVLIYGAAVARASGWDQAVALAEKMDAPVWAAPASWRITWGCLSRSFARICGGGSASWASGPGWSWPGSSSKALPGPAPWRPSTTPGSGSNATCTTGCSNGW